MCSILFLHILQTQLTILSISISTLFVVSFVYVTIGLVFLAQQIRMFPRDQLGSLFSLRKRALKHHLQMTQPLNFRSTTIQYHSPFQLVPVAKYFFFNINCHGPLSAPHFHCLAQCLLVVDKKARAFLEFFSRVVLIPPMVFLASTLTMVEGSVTTEASVFQSMSTPVRLQTFITQSLL